MFNNFFSGRVLVIAPHPDDELIGCGGTLLRFRAQVTHLAIAHLTGSPERIEEFLPIREAFAVDSHHALGLEDGFCAAVPRELTLALIRVIQTEKPDVLLVPHQHEAHSDHRIAWSIVRDAVEKARYWPNGGEALPVRVPTVLEYEVWTAIREPVVIYDVSNEFRMKCELIAKYASQVESFPYIQYVAAFNAWRGMLHHRGGHAEAFGAYSV